MTTKKMTADSFNEQVHAEINTVWAYMQSRESAVEDLTSAQQEGAQFTGVQFEDGSASHPNGMTMEEAAALDSHCADNAKGIVAGLLATTAWATHVHTPGVQNPHTVKLDSGPMEWSDEFRETGIVIRTYHGKAGSPYTVTVAKDGEVRLGQGKTWVEAIGSLSGHFRGESKKRMPSTDEE
jgi:hypothetical protein